MARAGLGFVAGWLVVLTLALPARAAEADSYYYERAIQPAELRGRTLRELELLEATIHARAGLVFLKWWLRDHFSSLAWYKPGRYDASKLSAFDRANLKTIAAYRASVPAADLRARYEELTRRHAYSFQSPIGTVAFSEDGERFATAALDWAPIVRPVSLWDTASGKRLNKVEWVAPDTVQYLYANGLRAHQLLHEPIRDHRFVGSELLVVTAYDVLVGDPRVRRGRARHLIGPDWSPDGGRDAGFIGACASPNGKYVAAYDSGRYRSFDATTGLEVAPPALLALNGVTPQKCHFIDGHRAVVKESVDGRFFLFDARAGKLEALAVPPGQGVPSRDGGLLAHEDPSWPYPKEGSDLSIWDLRGTPRSLRTLPGTQRGAPLFSPDGRKLLVTKQDGSLTLWDLHKGTPVLSSGPVDCMVFEDSHDLGYSIDTFGLGLRDDGPTLPKRTVAKDRVMSAAFSPDGTRILVVRFSGIMELLDARTGAAVPTFLGHEPWSEEDLREVLLIARRLGLRPDPDWRTLPEDVSPLDHLAALDQPLPADVLERMTRQHLRLLRNAVLARRGAPFKSERLRMTFSEASWYKPLPDYGDRLLTDIDKQNIRLIERRERQLGGAMTEAEDLALEMSRGVEGPDFRALPHPSAKTRPRRP